MNRRRQLSSAARCADFDDLLGTLRDNLGKADAYITIVEELVERSWSGDGDEGHEGGDSVMRRRNHVAHLVESTKRAVRAAISYGEEIDKRRQGE